MISTASSSFDQPIDNLSSENVFFSGIESLVILGAGAIGCLIASKIQKTFQGQDKLLRICDTRGTIRSNNLKISCTVKDENSFEETDVTYVDIFNKEEVPLIFGGKIDLLLICCKNFSTKADLEAFLNGLPSDIRIGHVLTLQNGFGNVEFIEEILKTHGIQAKVSPMLIYSGVKIVSSTSNSREIFKSINKIVSYSLPITLENSLIHQFFDCNEYFKLKKFITSSLSDPNKFIDWEKILVNSVINPLTTIFEVKCGELLKVLHLKIFAKSLSDECIQIMRNLPGALEFLGSVADDKFEEAAFEKVSTVIKVCEYHVSSMLNDFQEKRGSTEIDSLNNVFVKLAKERNMGENAAKINQMMVQMVNSKFNSN